MPIQIRKPQWVRLGSFELVIAFNPLTTRSIHVVINKGNLFGSLERAPRRLHVLKFRDGLFAFARRPAKRLEARMGHFWMVPFSNLFGI